MKKIVVLSIFNKAGYSNIGLENFANVSSKNLKKYVAVYKQPKVEAENYIKELYPDSEMELLTDVNSIFKLRKIIKKIRPDIIHVHHTLPAFYVSILRIFMNFKLLTTVHSLFNAYGFFQKIAFYLIYKASDLVVCNSKYTASIMPKSISESKKKAIYNGINFSLIDESYLHQRNEILRVGTICRLVPQKDLATLLHSFSKFTKTTPSVLYIVGDGPEMSFLKDLALKLGITDKVFFTGGLSRVEAYKQLHMMDIFVVSSKIEGFCNAMVEAAGASKPVIASFIGPLPEVLGENNALFFNVGSVDELTNCLISLSKSRPLMRELGSKANSFVRLNYSIEKSSALYKELYFTMACRNSV